MATHYLQTMLFVAHKESNLCGAPITQVPLWRNNIVTYALLPRIRNYRILSKCFARSGIIVLNTADKISPFLADALRRGRVELIEMVVRVGVLMTDSQGRLIVTVEPFNVNVLPVLLNNYVIDESLPLLGLREGELPAIALKAFQDKPNWDILRRLIDLGPNLQYRHADGGTFLHFAVRQKDEQLLSLAVESGAQINAKTRSGLTPLHLVINDHHFLHQGIANRLLEKGADVNAVTGSGLMPLHLTIKKHGRFLFFIQKLLESGADINATSPWGSVLQLASQAGLNCLACVLRYRPDIHARSNRRFFQDVLRSWHHQTNILNLLLQHGFVPENTQNVDILTAKVMESLALSRITTSG